MPVNGWQSLALPDLARSQVIAGNTTIQVALWDRTLENVLRPYPAFRGQVVLRPAEVPANGPAEILIKMVSQVSVKEYD